MKTLSSTEAELKKGFAYKKKGILINTKRTFEKKS